MKIRNPLDFLQFDRFVWLEFEIELKKMKEAMKSKQIQKNEKKMFRNNSSAELINRKYKYSQLSLQLTVVWIISCYWKNRFAL
jgi:hypothetical protein